MKLKRPVSLCEKNECKIKDERKIMIHYQTRRLH